MKELDRWLAEKVMGWVGENKRSNSFLLIWHPTTDISQAFQVVERMKTINKFQPPWFELSSRPNGYMANFVGDPKYSRFADNPAMAICLAAKEAVGD